LNESAGRGRTNLPLVLGAEPRGAAAQRRWQRVVHGMGADEGGLAAGGRGLQGVHLRVDWRRAELVQAVGVPLQRILCLAELGRRQAEVALQPAGRRDVALDDHLQVCQPLVELYGGCMVVLKVS
jgi:hypothetical protein